MCGIVGFLAKTESLREQLGQLLVPMLVGMTERGPDSAGVAVFTRPVATQTLKFSVYADDPGFDWAGLTQSLGARFADLVLTRNFNHAILITQAERVALTQWLSREYPGLHVLSSGRSIDLYKDVGLPADIAARYRLNRLSGTHVVAHTRMATESANTPENAHPYTAGDDWCLVHNGSLANPFSLKRKLEKLGIKFESDCDTEAACRYIAWRLAQGEDLESALQHAFEDFDGFFTFLMGTHDKLALVRDPYACKPAVVAETDEYVAIASEFRSLAKLPGIKSAQVFEPRPAEIYTWSI